MRWLSYLLVLLFALGSLSELASAQSTARKRTTLPRTRSAKAPLKKKISRKVTRPRAKRRDAATLRRVRRINRTFVESAALKPMARQLLEMRTKAAFAGVERYARRHAKTEAGALANLVLGYAHILDRNYTAAIAPLVRARAQAGEVGDYVSYYLALAYGGSNRASDVVATLRDFDALWPDSLFLRDAVEVYANALIATGDGRTAAAVLEKHRNPTSGSVELALARAYVAAGDLAKADPVLRNLLITLPTSDAADDAEREFSKLAGQVPPLSFDERRRRADNLALARRNSAAAAQYRELLNEAPAEARTSLQMALGVALEKLGRDSEARQLLESLPDTGDEVNAQRLRALAEIARDERDDVRFTDAIARLRQNHVASAAFEDALLSGGNMYLLRRDYDKAIDYFRELQQRFSAGRRASYAHWKSAWLSYRQGRRDEARTLFERQIDWYPTSPEVPNALYWRARLAEADGDLNKAHTYYTRLAERFRHYYYAELARERLEGFTVRGTPPPDPLLAKIPELAPAGPDPQEEIDALRVEKTKLLINAGLTEFAIRELRAGAVDSGPTWAAGEIARIYKEAGLHHRALQSMKRSVPSYFALEFEELPRNFWEALFPRPYWAEITRFSARNGLDPNLVAALIRQESEFNPGALSRANAWGLMQLLPETARGVARQEKMRRFSTGMLVSPPANIQLGTRYFRQMIDRFDGHVEYALAAYNAGAHRVTQWTGESQFNDMPEFVESIPFTETREYVQAIVRNARIYRLLYSQPGRAAAH